MRSLCRSLLPSLPITNWTHFLFCFLYFVSILMLNIILIMYGRRPYWPLVLTSLLCLVFKELTCDFKCMSLNPYAHVEEKSVPWCPVMQRLNLVPVLCSRQDQALVLWRIPLSIYSDLMVCRGNLYDRLQPRKDQVMSNNKIEIKLIPIICKQVF